MSKHTLVLDSSQISCFLECPQLWQYKYVQRLTPQHYEVDATYMNAGTYGHSMLDVYYKARARHETPQEAIAQAFSYNPDTDTCECGCKIDSHKLVPAFNILECRRCKHCANFKAKPFALDSIVRSTVQNRLREYFFKYQDQDFTALSEQHVEVGFSEPIYEDTENFFVLEGRIDLLGSIQGLPCAVDHKFQFKTHYLYPKSVQFKNYALISKVTMFFINYIRLRKEPGPTNLERVICSFTVPELLAWKQKLIQVFFKIKEAQLSSDYEKRWNSCKGYGETYKQDQPKYCIYNPLCEEINSDIVERKQQTLYQVNQEVWKPW